MASPFASIADNISYCKQQQQQQQLQQQLQQQHQQQQHSQHSLFHDVQQQQHRSLACRLPATMHFANAATTGIGRLTDPYQQQQHTHNMTSTGYDSLYHVQSHQHHQNQSQHQHQQQQQLQAQSYSYGNSFQYNDSNYFCHQRSTAAANAHANYMQCDNAYTTPLVNRNRYSPYTHIQSGMYSSVGQQLTPSSIVHYPARNSTFHHHNQQQQLQQQAAQQQQQQAAHQQQQQQQQQLQHQQMQLRRNTQKYIYDTPMDTQPSQQQQYSDQPSIAQTSFNMQLGSSYHHMQNAHNSHGSMVNASTFNQTYGAITEHQQQHQQQQQQQQQEQQQEQQHSYHQIHHSMARPGPALTPALNFSNHTGNSTSHMPRPASVCGQMSHDAFLSHPSAQTSSSYRMTPYPTLSSRAMSSACLTSDLPTLVAPNSIANIQAMASNIDKSPLSKVKCDVEMEPHSSPHPTVFGTTNQSGCSPLSTTANGNCITTSPPLVSATGTDSGISSCSTGRGRGGESTQSTPVYSYTGEYPMSVGSSSGVSYHYSDGKEFEETIKEKDEPQIPSIRTDMAVKEMEIQDILVKPVESEDKKKTNDDPKSVEEEKIEEKDTKMEQNDALELDEPEPTDLFEMDSKDKFADDDTFTNLPKTRNSDDELEDDSQCSSSTSIACQPPVSPNSQDKSSQIASILRDLASSNSGGSSPSSERCLTPFHSPVSLKQENAEVPEQKSSSSTPGLSLIFSESIERDPMPSESTVDKINLKPITTSTSSSTSTSTTSATATVTATATTTTNETSTITTTAKATTTTDTNPPSLASAPAPSSSPTSLTSSLLSLTTTTPTEEMKKTTTSPHIPTAPQNSPAEQQPVIKKPAIRTPSPLNSILSEMQKEDELKKEIKKEKVDEISENFDPEMHTDSLESTPLPGFQQAFGATEIGRFAGTFGEQIVLNDPISTAAAFEASSCDAFYSNNNGWDGSYAGLNNTTSNSCMPWSIAQQQQQQQRQQQYFLEQQHHQQQQQQQHQQQQQQQQHQQQQQQYQQQQQHHHHQQQQQAQFGAPSYEAQYEMNGTNFSGFHMSHSNATTTQRSSFQQSQFNNVRALDASLVYGNSNHSRTRCNEIRCSGY